MENIDDSEVVANDVNDSIVLDDSSNNVIVNNIGDNNGGGIGLFTVKKGSNNNEVHANTTNNNTRNVPGAFSGLMIALGSTGNNVTGNYSFANLFLPPFFFDMADFNPNCGTGSPGARPNKWRGNHFGTANQSCIQSGEDEGRKDDDRKDDN